MHAARGYLEGEKSMDQAVMAEAKEYLELGAKIQPGDVVVDVGANIGAFSQIAAELTNSNVRLLCFEPEPSLFGKLEHHFRTQDRLRRSRHELFPLALSSEDQAGKTLDFYFFKRLPTDSTLNLDSKLREFEIFFDAQAARLQAALALVPGVGVKVGKLARHTVQKYCRADNKLAVKIALKAAGMQRKKAKLDTLANVVATRGVDKINLLKIDVEGAELDVLRGAKGILERVEQVVLETYDREGRANEIEELLKDAGFTSIKRMVPQTAVRQNTKQTLMLATRLLH